MTTLLSESDHIICSQINLHHCAAAAQSINDWMASTVHTNPISPLGQNNLNSSINDNSNINNSNLSFGNSNNTNLNQNSCSKTNSNINMSKIVLIQEPYCPFGRVRGFSKDFNIFTGKENAKVRACILTTKNIGAWLLGQYSNEDQVAIAFKTNNKIIVLVSTYMPGDSIDAPPPQILKDLTLFCEGNGWDLLVGADANSHNLIWGSTNNNKRGEDLLEFIMTSNLHLCNTGTKPTFVTANREEVLDITLASTRLLDKIVNWKVSDADTVSDHKRLEFNIRLTHDNLNTNFRNVRKTNWDLYRTKLERKTNSRTEQEDLDTLVNELEEDIIESYHESCKLITKKKPKKQPWWNNDLKKLKDEAKKMRHKYERSRTEEDLDVMRRTRNSYISEVKKAKKQGFEKLCTDMKDLNTAAKLKKVLQWGKQGTIGTIRRPSGEYTNTPEETLQVLLETHFPRDMEKIITTAATATPTVTELSTAPSVSIEPSITGNTTPIKIEDIINEETVRASINSFQPFKSPGMDGIYPILLQQGLDIIESKLQRIYEICIKTGNTPASWLETKVVFIPKPGKTDYTDPKSFRPISLSSFMLKGLERLIFWHINNTTLKKNPLHRNLYSYREGMSTEDALHNLVNKIEKALENNEVAVILFLDMDAAFSSASIQGITKNLKKQEVEPELVRWSENMLRNRRATATLNNETVTLIIEKGTPQGGILSVLFWNLDMNDLLHRFPEKHYSETNAFADDAADIVIGKDENTVCDLIQQDVKIFEEWACEHQLSFSATKTKVMMITRRRNKKKKTIYINKQPIEWVDSIKYLGVTLDSKLNWKPHITQVTNRAIATFAQCRKMIGKTWGLKPHICKWMYTSLIRPIISYGSLVLAKSLENATHIAIFEKLQRQVCLSILNAMRSTPTAGMEAIIGLIPIEIHMKTICIMSFLRLKENGNWKPQPGSLLNPMNHSNMVVKWAEQIPNLIIPRDKLTCQARVRKQFNTQIDTRDHWKTTTARLTPTELGVIHCFTDGSKNAEYSGAGYIIRGLNLKAQGYFQLGAQGTVFQAEVMALQVSATELQKLEVVDQNIQFYTDSQAAIKALNKYSTNSKCVLECKETLNQLAQTNKININWIPGHQGQLGNEVADRLAKRGADLMIEGPEPIIPAATANIKQFVKQWAEKTHQKKWERRKDCRQSKIFVEQVQNKIWKTIVRQCFSRKETRWITQIMTGHACLNRQLFIMKLEDSPTCDFCEEGEESSMHFLGECPYFSRIRHDIFGIYFFNNFNNIDPSKILKYIRSTRRWEPIEEATE